MALAAAIAVTAAAFPLGLAQAEQPQQLVPAARPPWGDTVTTTTETTPAQAPAATPTASGDAAAALSGQGNVTPVPGATPVQGTTTPIQAVSLRSGPNTGSPVIGTLRPGMAVQVHATANYGWVQVETPAGSGWAYGSYFAPINNAAPDQQPNVQPTADQEPAVQQPTVLRPGPPKAMIVR